MNTSDRADANLLELCELGQERLMAMEYIAAEAALVEAEAIARPRSDWDALARLYLPLQEARRQRRQRCGEGIVRLDLIAAGPQDHLDGRRIADEFPHGQLLVAGWGTIEPARQLRAEQTRRGLYVETFLAAAYPVDGSIAVVIVPLEMSPLPPMRPRSVTELIAAAGPASMVHPIAALPNGPARGRAATYERVMEMWERLHRPFLKAADAQADPLARIDAYRQTIEVDYACELAHQNLAATARELGRPPEM